MPEVAYILIRRRLSPFQAGLLNSERVSPFEMVQILFSHLLFLSGRNHFNGRLLPVYLRNYELDFFDNARSFVSDLMMSFGEIHDGVIDRMYGGNQKITKLSRD